MNVQRTLTNRGGPLLTQVRLDLHRSRRSKDNPPGTEVSVFSPWGWDGRHSKHYHGREKSTLSRIVLHTVNPPFVTKNLLLIYSGFGECIILNYVLEQLSIMTSLLGPEPDTRIGGILWERLQIFLNPGCILILK